MPSDALYIEVFKENDHNPQCWFLSLQYLDVELLIGGTKQEAKKKLLEEIREEALETAIAKVIVQIQLEKEEEEERKN